ncbi:MAG: hypothetical protein M3Y13_08100 [Armatimonadota bacterium]|nr:hypothetical protein [Armatimonadota bacterium]
MAKTVFTLLLLALIGGVVSAAPAKPIATTAVAATTTAHPVLLYDGKAVSPTTLTIADWGGGSGEESAETYIFGGHSLKVTTLDPYQGARITFASPVPLSGDNRVLQIIVHRDGVKLHYDPRTVGMPETENPNGFNPGQFQGRNNRQRRRPGPTGPIVSRTPLIPDVTKLRLQLMFADGRQADVVRPISETADAAAGEGWYSVNVPLSTLNLSGAADPMLKSMTIGGDHYGVFFIGRIQLATDKPTLNFTIDGPDHIPAGVPIKLIAKGDPGLSVVKYDWNLGADSGVPDPATDTTAPAAGIPAMTVLARSANDDTIVVQYSTAGEDHTITLTVTDTDGLKKPVTVTKTIHVQGDNTPGGR